MGLYGNLLLGIYGNKMFKRDNPPKGVLQAYYISIHARNDVPCLLFLSGALWMDLNQASLKVPYQHPGCFPQQMKHKGFRKSKLWYRLDIEIQNAKIVTTWEILQRFTKLAYKGKVHVLMYEYNLSSSRVEDIIQENFADQ